jgi:Zn-finger nucleic acid-binding protein
MALSCPRCQSAMVEERRTGAASGARLDVDTCPSCDGLWLDGVEVGQAFAGLREHGLRIDDLIEAGAKRGHGIGACPRCRGETVEFPFFELWLDLCSACHGMWIDGKEVEAVARSADHADGLPAPPVEGGYRDKAVAAAKTETTSCVRCSSEVPLRQTMMTGDGAVCHPCAYGSGDEDAENADVAEFESKLHGTGALGAIGRAFDAVAKAIWVGLSTPRRCSHCGCSQHSHCDH